MLTLYVLDLRISTLKPPPTAMFVKSVKSMVFVVRFWEPIIMRDCRLPLRRMAAAMAPRTTSTAMKTIIGVVNARRFRYRFLCILGFRFLCVGGLVCWGGLL